MCAHMSWLVCATAHWWGLVLSGEGSRVIRLGCKHLHSLSHLTGPGHATLMKVQMFGFSVLGFFFWSTISGILNCICYLFLPSWPYQTEWIKAGIPYSWSQFQRWQSLTAGRVWCPRSKEGNTGQDQVAYRSKDTFFHAGSNFHQLPIILSVYY